MHVRSEAAFLLAATIFLTALVRAEAETPPWAKVSPEQVAAAKKLGVPVAFENSVGMRFVLIPPGTFMMGSRDSAAEVARRCAMPNAQSGWFCDEHPRHEVTLTNAVYIAIHEVTQGCYEAVTNPKPGKDTKKKKRDTKKKKTDGYPQEFKGKDKPVGSVAWNDAGKFCKTLSSREAEKGRRYALPTEAQWEYACRAASTTPFSFGETASTGQANYHGDYTYGGGTKGENRGKPLAVGSLPANGWGLHDMHGNVSEWCADWYGEYAGAAASDPQGPAKGKQRVLRGGSWRSYPGACRSAFRHGGEGRARSYNLGFRVCCAVPAQSDRDK